MTAAMDENALKIDRITIYAGIATLVFIIVFYEIIEFAAPLFSVSLLEAVKQLVFLVAFPVFQISKSLFIPRASRLAASQAHWGEHHLYLAFLLMLLFFGIDTALGAVAGGAAGLAAARLQAQGLCSDYQACLAAIGQSNLSLAGWGSFLLAFALGWIAQGKNMRRPALFFVACAAFLMLFGAIRYFVLIKPDNPLVAASAQELALILFVFTPLIILSFLFFGFMLRYLCRLIADRTAS